MSNILVLQNFTGSDISRLFFRKFFGSNPDGTTIYDGTIPSGGSVNYNFTGGSGSGDYYTFDFYSGGQSFSRTRKRCDISLADIASSAPVFINFLEMSSGYSIVTPVSDPCLNNKYDSSSETSEEEAEQPPKSSHS